jgi:hypothetical protein
VVLSAAASSTEVPPRPSPLPFGPQPRAPHDSSKGWLQLAGATLLIATFFFVGRASNSHAKSEKQQPTQPVAVQTQKQLQPLQPLEPVAPASTVPQSQQTQPKPRPRQPLLVSPAPTGDAFQHYYEIAAVNVNVSKPQERALAEWARQPITELPVDLVAAVETNSKAFVPFDKGTSAVPSATRRLNTLLGQRILVLGRLELARARSELSSKRVDAAQHAFAVIRFAQDVAATGAIQGAATGVVIENEALSALEAWLQVPGWTAEDLAAAKALLAKVIESAVDVQGGIADHANQRLKQLPLALARAEQAAKGGKTP